jgi:hypothetical protein
LDSSSAAGHLSEKHQHLKRTATMEHKIEACKARESRLYMQYMAWFRVLQTYPQSCPHIDIHEATVDAIMAYKEDCRIHKLKSYHTTYRYMTEELLEHFKVEVFMVLWCVT